MVNYEVISKYNFGDTLIIYIKDKTTGNIGMRIIPSDMEDKVQDKKQYYVDSLVQLKIIGDDYPNGFSHGHTMRNGESIKKLKYKEQYVEQKEDEKTIITVFSYGENCIVENRVKSYKVFQAFEVFNTFKNQSSKNITLEMLSSFSLDGITPFTEGEAEETLVLHRLRSRWSAEARLESTTIEDLQLEPSWSRYGVSCERFGQVGSMPVRRYFPFAVVEDTVNKVCWGVQISHPASWQIEVYRRDDALALSGGLGDREFAHWTKEVKPDEEFTTPKAIIAAMKGGIDDISQRLTSLQRRTLKNMPKTEIDLPVIFNEFCTTWGNPSYENIKTIAQKLKGKGIRYMVVDCGWYASEGSGWESNMGDWIPNKKLFPEGIKKVVEVIKENGMVPGIWFELEICGRDAAAFNYTDHLLTRDGVPITTGNRRFWDFRDPFVIRYLTEKVINFIKENGFGYLKIDYNDNIGIGCDGAESLGEGLRQQMEAVQGFIRKIRADIPELVIENCSSGGHRLEPSMMEITSMSSFSDAHECLEIPIIAANVHRVIQPFHNQIWAVLRKEDSIKRLNYSLVNTMLGRMCLSGDVHELDNKQWKVIDEAIGFYKEVSPIIKEGYTTRFGPKIKCYGHPKGWQVIVRYSKNKKEALVIIHTFGGELPKMINLNLLHKDFKIGYSFGEVEGKLLLKDSMFSYKVEDNFEACAIKLNC